MPALDGNAIVNGADNVSNVAVGVSALLSILLSMHSSIIHCRSIPSCDPVIMQSCRHALLSSSPQSSYTIPTLSLSCFAPGFHASVSKREEGVSELPMHSNACRWQDMEEYMAIPAGFQPLE